MAMKRRLNDYLNASNLPVAKETKHFYKTQKISFKLFQQKETSHMRASYPFLSKAQINSKVRELWKNLPEEEQQKYSKVVLSKTPVKSPPGSNKLSTSKRKDIPRKNKCSIWQDFKTETTPSNYQSPQLIVQKSSPSWLKESPVSNDYSKAKKLSDVVPEVIDETPSKQLGILKQTEKTNADSDDEDSPCRLDDLSEKKRHRVSFSPAENLQNEPDSPIGSQGSSFSEDVALIRRDPNDVCNFDDIDNFSMCIESDEASMGLSKPKIELRIDHLDNFENKISKDNGSPEIQIKKGDNPEIKLDIFSEPNKQVKSARNKKSNKMTGKKTTPGISSRKRFKSTPMAPPSNLNQVTPMMDDATMKHLEELAKKAPKKRQSRGGKPKHDVLETDGGYKATSHVHKKHIRTSLICPKEDDEQDETMIDASGDAKSGQFLKDSDFQMVTDTFDASSEKSVDNLEFDGDAHLADEKLPPHLKTGSYFRIPDRLPDIELSDSDSEYEVFAACKSTSNDALLETLKRMQEATKKPKTPTDSPVVSPKILSPALSGISQLSSASSESKDTASESMSPLSSQHEMPIQGSDKIEQGDNLESIYNRTDMSSPKINPESNRYKVVKTECSSQENKENVSNILEEKDFLTDLSTMGKDQNVYKDETKPVKVKKITRFAKRKAPTALQELGKGADKTLCELFFDLTPPGEKQAKSSNRRLLSSAVTPGKSNFSSLFENQTIF